MEPGGGAFAHPVGLTFGAFEQLFATGGGKFDRRKSKSLNAPGVCPGAFQVQFGDHFRDPEINLGMVYTDRGYTVTAGFMKLLKLKALTSSWAIHLTRFVVESILF